MSFRTRTRAASLGAVALGAVAFAALIGAPIAQAAPLGVPVVHDGIEYSYSDNLSAYPVAAGSTLTYTVVAKNATDAAAPLAFRYDATGAVDDMLADGSQAASYAVDGAQMKVTNSIADITGTLAPGASATFTFSVNLSPTQIGDGTIYTSVRKADDTQMIDSGTAIDYGTTATPTMTPTATATPTVDPTVNPTTSPTATPTVNPTTDPTPAEATVTIEGDKTFTPTEVIPYLAEGFAPNQTLKLTLILAGGQEIPVNYTETPTTDEAGRYAGELTPTAALPEGRYTLRIADDSGNVSSTEFFVSADGTTTPTATPTVDPTTDPTQPGQPGAPSNGRPSAPVNSAGRPGALASTGAESLAPLAIGASALMAAGLGAGAYARRRFQAAAE